MGAQEDETVTSRRSTGRKSSGSRQRLLALAAILAFGLLHCAPPADSPLKVGEAIPAFDLEKLEGGRLDSGQLAGGGPVVVNFWATWCSPCVREIPTLQQLHRQQGARVVSIALDREGAEVVQPFVEQHGIDYPVLLGDLALFQKYGGVAIPYTLVLDEELKLHKKFKGLISLRTLERQIAEARGESGT